MHQTFSYSLPPSDLGNPVTLSFPFSTYYFLDVDDSSTLHPPPSVALHPTAANDAGPDALPCLLDVESPTSSARDLPHCFYTAVYDELPEAVDVKFHFRYLPPSPERRRKVRLPAPSINGGMLEGEEREADVPVGDFGDFEAVKTILVAAMAVGLATMAVSVWQIAV